MSVILVLNKTSNNKKIYYVVHADVDTHESSENWGAFITSDSFCTYSRAIALITAHDMQKALQTEFGVREVF